MIDRNYVCQVVGEWLEDKDYFLVEVTISPDDKIVVTIDHKEGVWMEDCVELSRYIESKLDREQEDYELEVGSAGLGQPFKVKEQYEAHVGRGADQGWTETEGHTDGRTAGGVCHQRGAEGEGRRRETPPDGGDGDEMEVRRGEVHQVPLQLNICPDPDRGKNRQE